VTWDHPDALTKISYGLKPLHEPQRCNYPHSEVVVHQFDAKDGSATPVTKIKPPTVKLKIREYLQNLVTIVLPMNRIGETLPIETVKD